MTSGGGRGIDGPDKGLDTLSLSTLHGVPSDGQVGVGVDLTVLDRGQIIFIGVSYLLEDGAVVLLALGTNLLNSLGGIQSSLDVSALDTLK